MKGKWNSEWGNPTALSIQQQCVIASLYVIYKHGVALRFVCAGNTGTGESVHSKGVSINCKKLNKSSA